MTITLSGRRRPLLLLIGTALMCIGIGGCGVDTYKSRLDETAAYFSYKEKLNQELGPTWSSYASLRVPKAFQGIPAPPPPPAPEEGEEPEPYDPAEDPRQPHYLGLEFPGLLGAWEATVMAESGGEEEPHTAYLYVLSNHARYLQPPDDAGFSEDPATFLTDLENLLTGAIGVVLPQGETGDGVRKNERYRATAPRGKPNIKFTPRKDFTAVTLKPEIDVSDLDLPIEMELYEWGGQKIQLAILVIYPQSISPREDLQDRLLLALETLQVDDVAPRSSTRSGAAPGSGGGGRSAGF